MKVGVLVLSVMFLALSGNIGLEHVEPQQHTIVVDSNNLRFNPESITINEGDSVNFLWSGELLPHNSVEENGVFDSGDAEEDVDYTYTFDFDQAGTYDFFCEPHQSVGMKGVITVLDVEQMIEDSNESIVSQNVADNDDDSGVIMVGSFVFGFGLLLLIYFRTRISDVYVL
jgi:plastocyanin